jgi:hypothetical protein
MRRYSNWLDIEGRCRYLLPSPNLCAGRRARWHAAARPHDAFCCPPQNVTPWSTGSVQRPSPLGWRDGGRFSSSWPRDTPSLPWGARWAFNGVGQALSRPASGGALRRPWPRGQGWFFPRRSPSTWYAWPANARIRGVAACPSGLVPHWRGSSSPRGSWRTSPPPPGAGFWPRIR